MKLITETVKEGDWIVVKDAAPPKTDLSPQTLQLKNMTLVAFVDGNDLRVRCPKLPDTDTINVKVKGITLGSIQILR